EGDRRALQVVVEEIDEDEELRPALVAIRLPGESRVGVPGADEEIASRDGGAERLQLPLPVALCGALDLFRRVGKVVGVHVRVGVDVRTAQDGRAAREPPAPGQVEDLLLPTPGGSRVVAEGEGGRGSA